MATGQENKAELLYYEGVSFKGIDEAHKVFIDFSKRKKNQGFVEIPGKEGLGKTSRLEGIAYNVGANLGIEKSQLANRLDGKIEEAVGVMKGGMEYRVEASTSRFTVKRKAEDGKLKVANDDTPTAMINDLFGNVMLLPDLKKGKKGKDRIKFFVDTFGGTSGVAAKIDKKEEEIETAFNKRTKANSEMTALKSALEIEPLYQNYEKSHERFAKPISAEKEKAAFDEKGKKKADYDRYAENLRILKASHTDSVSTVERLKAELAAAEALEKELAGRVEKGDKWMEANKQVLDDYEKANSEWLNLSRTLADQEKWKDILRREKLYNEKVEEYTSLDAEVAEKRDELKKLSKKALPKVEGLSIKLNAGLDKKVNEDVYYIVPGKKEEQPIYELSETEEADMWCRILEAEDVRFIFIENISSFGNSVVNTLNQFVKNGGMVFYTLMQRNMAECEVTFKSKIE